MRTHSLLLILLLSIFSLLNAETVRITLLDGTVVEGTIYREYESRLIIKTIAGNQTVRREQIKHQETIITPRQQYKQIMAKHPPKTVEDHLKYAKWCQKNKLTTEYYQHLHAVLKLDSNNEEAHIALGHEQYERKWLTDDGTVKSEILWVSQKEKERLKAEEENLAAKIREQQARDRLQNAETRNVEKTAGETATVLEVKDMEMADWEREFFMQYIPDLDNNDWRKRSIAIKTLVKQEFSHKVRPLLVEVCKTGSDLARESAIESLTLGRFTSTLPLMEEILKNDPAGPVRVKAAYALGEMGEPVAVKVLLDAIDDEDENVVSEVIVALEKLTFTTFDYLGRPDPDKARRQFKSWLANNGGKTRKQILIYTMQNGTPADRIKAVDLLFKLGDKESLQTLIDMLRHEDVTIQREANAKLIELTEEDFDFDYNTTSQEIKDKSIDKWQRYLQMILNQENKERYDKHQGADTMQTTALLEALNGPRKDQAKEQLLSMKRSYSIPLLLQGMNDSDFFIRAASFSLMLKISEELEQYDDYGYEPGEDNAIIRQAAIAKWETWYTENEAAFQEE